MENVANREDNRGLHETAHANLEWLRRWERVDEEDEDRRREEGAEHRVRGHERDVDARRARAAIPREEPTEALTGSLTFGPEPAPIQPSPLLFRDVGGGTIAATAGLLG